MNRFLRIAVFAVGTALTTPVMGQDFGAGMDAYRAENYPSAIANFLPLAEQGDSLAQFLLGLMYANGRGVLQDDAEAFRWFRLSVEQGNDDAEFSLGLMYEDGEDVPQDDVEAVRWYRLAAEQGHAKAQTNLGLMYEDGRGVTQDYAEAIR